MGRKDIAEMMGWERAGKRRTLVKDKEGRAHEILADSVKEYYEIVVNRALYRDFFPHHADLFTEMHL